MSYGKLRRLLSKEFPELCLHDSVLVESPFIETTRSGKHLYSVLLALTPDQIMIALETAPKGLTVPKSKETDLNSIYLKYLYPLELVQIIIFKRRRRQSLKFCTELGKTRYFELAAMKKRNIFWELWCYYTLRIRQISRFQTDVKHTQTHHQQTDYNIIEGRKKHLKWRDKYVYLGSKREEEDAVRPIPVPGLGPTEDIKLLYLKQKYFGCWDQSEHWVQCGNSGSTLFNFL